MNYKDITKYLDNTTFGGYEADFSNSSVLLPESCNDYYIGTSGKEIIGADLDYLEDKFSIMFEHLGQPKEIIIIVDISSRGRLTEDQFSHYNIKLVFLPYWMIWTHYAHEYLEQPSRNSHHQNKKFIFLPGKLYKKHRLAIVQSLYRRKWFNDEICRWSLSMPTEEGIYKDRVLELMDSWIHHSHMGFATTVDDLVQYNRNLDCDLDLHKTASDFHLTGLPYDVSIYDDIGFTIISETHERQEWHHATPEFPFFTEKTYRTIYNCLPFIDTNNHKEYLEQLGFKTFDDLGKHSKFISENGTEPVSFDQELGTAITAMRKAVVINHDELWERTKFNKQHMIDMSEDIAKQFEGHTYENRTFKNWLLECTSYHNCNSGKLPYEKAFFFNKNRTEQ